MSADGNSLSSRPTLGGGHAPSWIAAVTAASMLASILGWVLFGILGGVSELGHTPEQGGCYQPRVGLGIAMIGLGVLGTLGAALAFRSAVLVLRGRRPLLSVVPGLAVTLAALGGFLIVVLLFRPDLQFGAC